MADSNQYQPKDAPSIRALYPTLSDKQCIEAEGQLRDYVAFLMRLAEDIISDPDLYNRFKTLTGCK